MKPPQDRGHCKNYRHSYNTTPRRIQAGSKLRLLSKWMLLVVISCTWARAASPSPSPYWGGIEIDHVDGSTLYFRASGGTEAPKPMRTQLYELEQLGTLRPPGNGAPYFLFKGRACQNCLQDQTLYLIRPNGDRPEAFVFPGRIDEPRSRSMALESRGFWGHCLPQLGDVYVVYQKEYVDRRHGYQSSVYVAEAAEDHIAERLIERRGPRINTTLHYVKAKQCHEIPGRHRVMLSKPLDVNPRNLPDSDDDEDDNSSEE